MKNRKVVVYQTGGPQEMKIISDEIPEPRNNECLVKILAAGVSFADLLIREGVHPETPDTPFTPGWDLVGRIEKLGNGNIGFKPGQIVAALPIVGGYCEYICLPEKELVPVPDGSDPCKAVSLVLNYITAYQMMHRSAKVVPGQQILVHAASGGVGTALLQLGNVTGLDMYGTVSSINRQLVNDMGCVAIDYKSVDFVEEIHNLTGNGVEVVFDGIGGDHIWRSYRATRRGGKVIAYGLTSSLNNGQLSSGKRSRFRGLPVIAAQIGLSYLIPDGKKIVLYSIQNLRRVKPEYFYEDLSKLFNMWLEGKITPVISAKFPLEEATKAHEMLAKGTRGKIVLEM